MGFQVFRLAVWLWFLMLCAVGRYRRFGTACRQDVKRRPFDITFEDGTNILSLNVSKKVPVDAVQHHRKVGWLVDWLVSLLMR